jgi:tetratricopeptide (TPR) repeat protein
LDANGRPLAKHLAGGTEFYERQQAGGDHAFIGPVQVDFVEGFDAFIVRGDPRDAKRVQRIVEDLIEKTKSNDLQALSQSGEWFNLNLGRAGALAADAKELVARLAEEGAVLMPQLGAQETGYWNPAIVTDEKGQATVEFDLPDRSTAWKLLAKGITVETLAGEGDHEFTASKDVFGELKLPLAFTDGDEATILASVHNAALEAGKVEVTLKATIGEKTVTQTRSFEADKKGIREFAFSVKIELPEATDEAASQPVVALALTVASGELKDVLQRSIPIHPKGMPVFSLAGGSAEGDATAFVEEPQNMKLDNPRLQVIVGPSVERSLLDILLAPPSWCQVGISNVGSSVDSAASDLMAALALQQLFKTSRDAANPQIEMLDGRVRSSIGLLVSQQNDFGSWGWAGRGEGNRYSSARVVWALALAKSAGYRVDDEVYNKAITALESEIAKTRVSDYESKAVLLHALAVAGKGDFTLANQLYRNRPSLSPAGLAYLALAFAEMDRKQTADELLGALADRITQANGPAQGAKALPWNAAPAELRAIYALALDKTAPASPQLKEQVDWLLAHRTGHRWSPDKATGPAALVLGSWFARTRFEGQKYKLTIYVNDLLLETLEIDDAARTKTIDVAATFLAEGRQRVRFELEGRGRYAYQVVLGGFVPSERLKSTTNDWRVTRSWEPAPVEFEGKPVPRGFDVLTGSYQTFRNPLTQLPVAKRASLTIQPYRQNVSGATPDEELPYLVVTEPLPAGVSVVESSISGEFDRYEILPGAATFYLGNRRHFSPIHFDVYGYLPGEYGSPPTVVRNAYRPDEMAVADNRTLTVLPKGARSDDAYRLTPRELFELGKLHFAQKQHGKVIEHLAELITKWTLQEEAYKESVRMLLDAHLAEGPPEQVVHYFEIVIEKYPDVEIPFEKLLQVGDAYHKIGEYERSYLVFRATVEASFQRESRVAGFLENQGEFPRSVKTMASLLREYPPEAYLATATYALAQRVYAKAPEAAGDEKLKDLELTRVDLIGEVLAMLDTFLTAWPEDPAADEASFSMANALLDLEAWQKAIDACELFEKRYPQSRFLDSYWYVIGFCHYALGNHEKALEMCRKVAQYDPPDRDGRRIDESQNKWQAIYIMGQIHHSLGRAEPAIDEYRRVEERFPDARQAIDYFLHKEISLPEVTHVLPDQEAKVELKFRNLATADVTVYRIDLMKFSLMRRSLEEITRINLAGIRPFYNAAEKLGDGKDYRDRTASIKLPLDEEGAYLVVCRAGDLYASGLVVVSPLVVEVDEEAASGRVRTTVRNAVEDRYAAKVHVKTIGSANDDFTSGETDLRGVFVADGIRGEVLVIAQGEGSRYAFYRGKTWLGPPRAPEHSQAQEGAQPAEAQLAPSMKGGKDALLENLQEQNEMIQGKNTEGLKQLYDNKVDQGIGGGFGGGGIF